MTEMDFWVFLKTAQARNGKIDMVSGYVDSADPRIQSKYGPRRIHNVE